MKIDVRHLVGKEVGSSEDYDFGSHEAEDLLASARLEHFMVKIKLVNLETSVLAIFSLTATVTIECDRCLEPLKKIIALSFKREYSYDAEEEGLKITKDKINPYQAIIEETALNIPLKNICKKCEENNE